MAVVTPTILSGGSPIDPAFQLRSIDIRREVNRIPRAELVLADGDAARQTFEASDGTTFEPGQEIEIKLRPEGETEDMTVFKGVVVRHTVEGDHDDTALLVEAKDPAVKLTGARRSAVFRDKSDRDVVAALLDAAGLDAGQLADTEPVHPQLVQVHVTDWDFILSRAEANGLLVVANDGEISLVKLEEIPPAGPSVPGLPVPDPLDGGAVEHSFEWGVDEIFDFEMEAHGGHQFDAVESVAWDARKLAPSAAKKAASFALAQGNLDGAALGATLGFGTDTLSHPVALSDDELQAWADATLARSRMALLRGRLSTRGFADVALLEVVEIGGIGQRFNGKTLVTGIRHRVDLDCWRTDIAFGLSPDSWAERTERVADAPAAGLLPPVSGLRIGLVAPFEEDPDKELRVKVFLPSVDPSEEAVWARLASPGAGKERGLVFRPEAGDEVVVGFLNDDPRHPVVLGSLHGSKNRPAVPFATPTADNVEKGIVTRAGTTLAFLDDEKPSVHLATAGGNKVTVDDEGERIELADQHGNAVTLSKDGVAIHSATDLVIEAGGNVEIQGVKVDVK